MIHHMVDLETFGTTPRAVVLSIGIVAFDVREMEITGTHHVILERTHQISRLGRDINPSTIEWWNRQGAEARKLLDVPSSERVPLEDALVEVSGFLTGTQGVWGNGAAFDNVILASLYDDLGLEHPWAFWQDRCFRTLKHIAGNHGVPKPPFRGVPHNALDDAIHQFEHLREIAKALRLELD